MIAKVCTRAPKEVQAKFAKLERDARVKSIHEQDKRKRAAELLKQVQPPKKQSRLKYTMSATEVDDAWGEAFFGLDIPVRKIDHPLFRNALQATRRSKKGCVLIFIIY